MLTINVTEVPTSFQNCDLMKEEGNVHNNGNKHVRCKVTQRTNEKKEKSFFKKVELKEIKY